MSTGNQLKEAVLADWVWELKAIRDRLAPHYGFNGQVIETIDRQIREATLALADYYETRVTQLRKVAEK